MKTLLLSIGVFALAFYSYSQCSPDVTPPTSSCQDLTVYLDGSGSVTVNATDVDNGSSDNCALAGVYFARPIQLVITATDGDDIYTANLDGSNIQLLYENIGTGGQGPVGIEYEPTNNQIYIPGGNT
ncbi:MAG: hypothetical protein WDZ35_08145 [Crocinitomicaceae bacterium]